MIDFIKIPQERLKIFKQKGYSKQLEKLTGMKIGVNEEVSIDSADPLALMKIKEVVKAFGRGFEFDAALNLLDDEYYLETMNIQEFCGKSRDRLMTMRGRLIGSGGRTKKIIEKQANVNIAIYGKTVSIIGRWDGIQKAKRAVEGLLYGKKHGTVYKSLMEVR
jgi:ribosomal RNA assembly protein